MRREIVNPWIGRNGDSTEGNQVSFGYQALEIEIQVLASLFGLTPFSGEPHIAAPMCQILLHQANEGNEEICPEHSAAEPDERTRKRSL